MTDPQTQSEEAPAQDAKPAIITAEMFMASDFEAPIAGITNVQTFELSSAYYKAANEAQNAGDEAKTTAYVFLGHLMGIMLRATDKATPWGAQWEMTNGARSMLPSDATEQIAELVPLLSITKNPVLRARMADLIWWNDKSQASAASTAVESYVETVTSILDGKLHGYGDDKNSHQHDALHALQRSMSIANAISKKGALPNSITSATKALYEAAKNSEGYVACAEAAEMGCRTKIFDEMQVAKDLETLVVTAPPDAYPEAVRKASDLAAYLYGKNKADAGKERCLLHSVRLILAMSDACPQASAKASWVMDAIQALGKMKGHQALVSEMKKVLRELQEASTHEYVTISTPLDIGDDREAMFERFVGFDLSDALMNFALLEKSPSKEKLRQEVTCPPIMYQRQVEFFLKIARAVAGGKRLTERPSRVWRRQPLAA